MGILNKNHTLTSRYGTKEIIPTWKSGDLPNPPKQATSIAANCAGFHRRSNKTISCQSSVKIFCRRIIKRMLWCPGWWHGDITMDDMQSLIDHLVQAQTFDSVMLIKCIGDEEELISRWEDVMDSIRSLGTAPHDWWIWRWIDTGWFFVVINIY